MKVPVRCPNCGSIAHLSRIVGGWVTQCEMCEYRHFKSDGLRVIL